MDWITIVGYIASVLVAVTFTMKTMIPLRKVAILSNVAFIIYGYFGGLYPVLILHVCMFPLNIYRLRQMQQLIDKVKSASTGTYSFDWLVKYMKKETHKKGEELFKEGDVADKIYFVQEGEVEFPKYNRSVTKGQIFGEMGVFSPYGKRTSTGICKTDNIEIYSITKGQIMQLYYQNPSFGFYMVQLLIKRFIEDLD